jgi:vacuolar-type H+-ATPase subunit I/STV1
MRLIRNISADGKCKYAIVRLDEINSFAPEKEIQDALDALESYGVLEYSQRGDSEESFTIKLKDRNAAPALHAYASAALATDEELARDVEELAIRAEHHPLKHQPD